MQKVQSRHIAIFHNYDNVVFTGISCLIYITSLPGSYLLIFSSDLTLKTYVLKLDCLYLIVAILQFIVNKGKYWIFFFNGLFMLFLYFPYTLFHEPTYYRHRLRYSSSNSDVDCIIKSSKHIVWIFSITQHVKLSVGQTVTWYF